MNSAGNSTASSDTETDDFKNMDLDLKYKVSCLTSGYTQSAIVEEIRSLTCKYQSLLGQATKQIEKLSCDKLSLEKDHNKLLVTNVELAEELKLLYSEQKEWRLIEKNMIEANNEFACEVENLYAKEDEVLEKLEHLKLTNQSLEKENQKQKNYVKKMFTENLHNAAQLETMRNQVRKDSVLAKENEQLKLENEFLTNSQKSTSDRMHLLEKELESLKKEILLEKEKVSNLSSTVDKISAENEILTNEIKRFQQTPEDEDVHDILQTIQQLQGTQL